MDEKALQEAYSAMIRAGGTDFDSLRAAIARYLECQWRPMEEAPRDGTWIEAWRRHAVRPIDVKFNSVYGWFEDDHGNHVYDLLAWRHFPAPPGDKHEG